MKSKEQTLYKLTNCGGMGHYNNKPWGKNVSLTAKPKGTKLCSNQVVHAYASPFHALLFNSRHLGLDLDYAMLWLAKGAVVNSDGAKVGCKKLTTIREISIPTVASISINALKAQFLAAMVLSLSSEYPQKYQDTVKKCAERVLAGKLVSKTLIDKLREVYRDHLYLLDISLTRLTGELLGFAHGQSIIFTEYHSGGWNSYITMYGMSVRQIAKVDRKVPKLLAKYVGTCTVKGFVPAKRQSKKKAA